MREKLEVTIKSLSEDEVAQLTNLLSRRPTYGIARPSGKWLARQQEKMEKLPETVLEPKNVLRHQVKKMVVGARQLLGDLQLARPLAERAVLCAVHKPLNAFVIREIFWLLFLEIGSRLDPLRAWPHKSPTVAMFLTRVDSIPALVMSKELYVQRFKAAPHDERFVRVESECEACILASIGANGRCLADLYAATKLRERHAKSMSARRGKRPRTPRLARFVEHWICSMEDPQAVYAFAEEVMAEIRPVQRDIKRYWRGRDKRRSDKASRGKSQPRHAVSLPRAQAESESMDQRRVAALHRPGVGQAARSVYCEDSLVNEPIHGASTYYPPLRLPGTAAERGPDEAGEEAFRGPDTGMDRSVYDDSWDHDVEDIDLEPGKRGPGYSAQDTQDRISNWYSRAGGVPATADGLHPALFTHDSAVPSPLYPTPPPPPPESSCVGACGGWPRTPRTPTPRVKEPPQARRPAVAAPRDQDVRTEWTDCTVHTYQDPGAAAETPVSSLYGDRGTVPAADGLVSPPDGASTPRPGRSGHHHKRSPLLPPPPPLSSSPVAAARRRSTVNAANLGRHNAKVQRPWERKMNGWEPSDDDHDSISSGTPARSDVTTLGVLMRRHERGR